MDCLARMEKMMQDVFIIGSRGLPARYGGFETFVSELINHQKSFDIILILTLLTLIVLL